MTKIVINRCHGGFGLSDRAILRYAELKGIKLYKYTYESPSRHRQRGTTITPEEFNSPEYKEDFEHFFNLNHLDRDDPLLVQVVEELGGEANTWASDLKVVEIPNNVNWTIQEYDGVEWVAETHRIWS